MSQYSVWLALSGVAEGSNSEVQKKLFSILNLPEDSCYREKYYEVATSLESSGLGVNGSDVTLERRRVFALDNSIKVNKTWSTNVRASGLIEAQNLLLESAKEIIKAKKDFNLQGNSVILDSLDYSALWTTAFNNASIETADFFDDSGRKIGSVELMKVKKRVELAHLPFLNAKLLELPVGTNGRYRMLFIINLGKNSLRRTIEHFPSSFIVDSMPLLLESVIPLEVAIPRFKMTSELDLRKPLEDVKVDGIWMDANSSKYISTPSPQLSTLIQRVTISMDHQGLTNPPASSMPTLSGLATGLAGAVGREFKANRPFLYGLVDAQTRTWLFSGAFSDPSSVESL
ncbi:serpin (serine protease inhibitor) domain-containing protein [Phthorimaea operculella]|nr:serpin (serine protease inhibitor) domain-containing protein [Phthorimaea operculella]